MKMIRQHDPSDNFKTRHYGASIQIPYSLNMPSISFHSIEATVARVPPANTTAFTLYCANTKAAAELRRPVWQYSTYSLLVSRLVAKLRISFSGKLIAPAM